MHDPDGSALRNKQRARDIRRREVGCHYYDLCLRHYLFHDLGNRHEIICLGNPTRSHPRQRHQPRSSRQLHHELLRCLHHARLTRPLVVVGLLPLWQCLLPHCCRLYHLHARDKGQGS